MLAQLATFAANAKKHEDEEEKENMMILRLEMKCPWWKPLIDEEKDFLNDNIIPKLCEDKIPQFESIFKDPNVFKFINKDWR